MSTSVWSVSNLIQPGSSFVCYVPCCQSTNHPGKAGIRISLGGLEVSNMPQRPDASSVGLAWKETAYKPIKSCLSLAGIVVKFSRLLQHGILAQLPLVSDCFTPFTMCCPPRVSSPQCGARLCLRKWSGHASLLDEWIQYRYRL